MRSKKFELEAAGASKVSKGMWNLGGNIVRGAKRYNKKKKLVYIPEM